MKTTLDLRCEDLSPGRWLDFERLFGTKGDCAKQRMKALIEAGEARGGKQRVRKVLA